MTCPVCGGANPHEAQFCSSCGVPIGSQEEPGATEDIAGKIVVRSIPGLFRETFRVYASGFQNLLFIAAIPQVLLIPLEFFPDSRPLTITVLMIGISLVLSVLANGAMVCAVSQQYLGRPIKVRDCYGRAWARVLSLVLSTAAFSLAIVGAIAPGYVLSATTAIPLATVGAFSQIIGLPLAIYLAVNWFFFSECIILERKGPLTSLWHSRELVRGNYWRVLLIGALFAIISIVWMVAAFAVSLIFGAASAVLANLVLYPMIAVFMPIMLVGEPLVYYDLRARKEGYSIENLVQEMGDA